jgi:ribosomal protein S18 acetylase RimI-like enzyme
MITLEEVTTSGQLAIVRELLVEYAHSLNVSLCFENLDKELAELPGPYAPPSGRLLLAVEGERVAGCGALKKVDEQISEMKRLFLRPEFRGKGVGRAMTLRLLDEARSIGYKSLRLDTLPSMKEAIALYRSLGFQEISPFRPLPAPGTLFMTITL